MELIIEEWWSKVVEDHTNHFGTRPLPEFQLHKRSTVADRGGWKTKEDWKDSIKGRINFEGFDPGGKAKLSGGSFYGIKSYFLVYIE